MIKKLGIRTDGTEVRFEQIFKQSMTTSPYFTAIEIGTAGADTLKAMDTITRESLTDKNWSVIGVDLPNGYSLDWNRIAQNFPKNLVLSNLHLLEDAQLPISPALGVTSLYLIDSFRLFTYHWNTPINFALIDGCHCCMHGKTDFLAIEPFVAPGGYVLFHDFGIPEQGTDPQCNGQGIDIRRATQELGLFESPNKRPNWEFVEEIKGSRHWGGDGNSFGVFRKNEL